MLVNEAAPFDIWLEVGLFLHLLAASTYPADAVRVGP